MSILQYRSLRLRFSCVKAAGLLAITSSAATAADAYLAWALLLMKRCGVDLAEWSSLADYLELVQQRPKLEEAIALEQQLRKTLQRSCKEAAGSFPARWS
jgi:hypothetical protein